ncbi:RNA polymerase sigma factor [Flavihumibacter fluvii]|uniref:RNA polymerase sigma factor n=1 Tax=Flavihumibacter fluvii TaxID=2838157 RepID=UPI001BDE69A5|nr:sigma-70 family RNA polymerase sigma factor [Flavihumibacter fluvii]ULQ51991.1 sigma-70 family RNA polymerase sigma factor [Flavihumibacter fluvii]
MNTVDRATVNRKGKFLSAAELALHIEGCALKNRESQEIIYTGFYGYAKTVCNGYCRNHNDVTEIINDGFLRVFQEIHRFTPAFADARKSFKGWLRRIMINTAINHFRMNRKHRLIVDLDDTIVQVSVTGEDAFDKISYQEIIGSLQQLTPGYRTVLNLYLVKGFTHEEISGLVGISIGTSKSNLAKAKKQLKGILFQQNKTSYHGKN